MSIARDFRGDSKSKKGHLMKTKKCPVCDWEIKDGGIKVKVAGKEIVVCCDDCAKKAKESPAKYAEAKA
jgi:ribosome-binding protein aMBF1 (putative translation factor)